MSDSQKVSLDVSRKEDALVITIPLEAPDAINSVVVLDIDGIPDVYEPPEMNAELEIFVDDVKVSAVSEREDVEIRYTLDGSVPNINSVMLDRPIHLTETTVISARCFKNSEPVSATVQKKFTKVQPQASVNVSNAAPGLRYEYFVGNWNTLPDFNKLNLVKKGVLSTFV